MNFAEQLDYTLEYHDFLLEQSMFKTYISSLKQMSKKYGVSIPQNKVQSFWRAFKRYFGSLVDKEDKIQLEILKKQLRELLKEYKKVVDKYGYNSPQVKELKKQIADIKNEIKEVEDRKQLTLTSFFKISIAINLTFLILRSLLGESMQLVLTMVREGATMNFMEQLEYTLDHHNFLLEQATQFAFLKEVQKVAKKYGIKLTKTSINLAKQLWKNFKETYGELENKSDELRLDYLKKQYKLLQKEYKKLVKNTGKDSPVAKDMEKELEKFKKELDKLSAQKKVTLRSLFKWLGQIALVLFLMHIVTRPNTTATAHTLHTLHTLHVHESTNVSNTNNLAEQDLVPTEEKEIIDLDKRTIVHKLIDAMRRFKLRIPKDVILDTVRKFYNLIKDAPQEKYQELKAQLDKNIQLIQEAQKSGLLSKEELDQLVKETKRIELAVKAGQNWKKIAMALLIMLVLTSLILYYIKSKQNPQPQQ